MTKLFASGMIVCIGNRSPHNRTGNLMTDTYTIVHTVWTANTANPMFGDSQSLTSFKLGTILGETREYAHTDRGARWHVARTVNEIKDDIVAVYYAPKGRSVIVISITNDGVRYADSFQPFHTAHAVYWDAETIARTVAAKASQGRSRVIVAEVY